MNYFDKYINIKCPECGKNLDSSLGLERVIKENPKWNELSSYRIHRCSHCGTSLKFKTQIIYPILFIFLLIFSWYGYNYVYDLYSKGMASIFMLLMGVFVFIPIALLTVSKLQLIKDA